MTDLIVELPWPDRKLHPNARVHHMARYRAGKASKKEAEWLAVAAGLKGAEVPEGRLHVWIDAYPPDRRRRDEDGLLSSLKWALDGIAAALGVDDSRFIPHPLIHDDKPMKGGVVMVKITGGPQP